MVPQDPIYKNNFRLSVSDNLIQLTMVGLGTAATTMPMVGWGERRAGLPQGMAPPAPGVALSARLAWASPGRGDCSFCSCCFFWILRWSCCLASMEGDGRVFTCGWKAWASGMGTNAEVCMGVLTPEETRAQDKSLVVTRPNTFGHICRCKTSLPPSCLLL